MQVELVCDLCDGCCGGCGDCNQGGGCDCNFCDCGDNQFLECVVIINCVLKVVKGGCCFSFIVFVVVGDGNGLVGVGYGKVCEVFLVILKGVEEVKCNFFCVLCVGSIILYFVQGEVVVGVVLFCLVVVGIGVIVGGLVCVVFECVGIYDVLLKLFGLLNMINIVYVMVIVLKQFEEFCVVVVCCGFEFDQVVLVWFVCVEVDVIVVQKVGV